MRKTNLYVLVIAASLFSSHQSFAVTMSTLADISLGTTSYTSSDTRSIGTSQSTRTYINGNPEYYSRALSNESGKTAVAAKIDYSYDYDSSSDLFDAEPHINTATASWSNIYSGTGSVQTLHFNIDQGLLGKTSYYGEESTLAGYGINILLNGNSIWSSHDEISASPYYSLMPGSNNGTALYFNDYDDNQLSYSDVIDLDNGHTFFRVYDPFTGELDLGAFAAGESFEISYTMSVYVYSDYFIGWDYAMAQFSDPLDLSGDGGVSVNISSSPVPVPAALPLFGSALGLFGFIGKKRRTRKA